MLDVFKRILAAALGAMGLGALAGGPAFAQSAGSGNIPAPNIFDDQITCTMLLPSGMDTRMPTMVPDGAMTSPLDDAIGMGTVAVTDSETLGLGYVIPAGNMNCGAGTTGPMLGTMNIDAGMNGSFLDADDTIAWGSIPKDVADGYTELLGLYQAVYGNPGMTTGGTQRTLDAAQKALTEELAKDSPSQALVTTLTRNRDDAQTAHNKALAAFNAASQGPIYQAGVAEWMAKAAVTQSIEDYNTQVTTTNEALTALNAMEYSAWTYDATAGTVTQGRSKYVPLGNDELITTVVTGIADGMATVAAYSVLQGYANHDGTQTGTHGMAGTGDGTGSDDDNVAPVASVTTDSNFDSAGRLIVPMEINTDTADDPIDIRTAVDGTNDTVTLIRTRVMAVRTAEQALKKARDENLNPLLQDVLDEAYRRAKVERDYYDGLYANVLADTTDARTADQRNPENDAYSANPISIASRNGTYSTEENKREAAETDLRAKVAAREMATANVRGQFSNAQAFYNQLVARREALKAKADQEVTDASQDGGTPSKTLTDAAADAQEALEAAQMAKANVDGFFEDADAPSAALINTLLETDGDDGQALVDAISATYEVAAGAADAAREVVNELTGEGGAVAMNTANIATNTENIATNAGNIATNATNIATNAGNIATNAENIATNAGNIATNATNIAANEGRITQNESDIMTNAGNIAGNREMIMMQQGTIDMNTMGVMENRAMIDSNQMSIMRNMEDIQTLKSGVAASMALAGMPEMGARGVSVGAGSYGGETALAVGVHFSGENSRFKIGVTSSGGETGASLGAGWSF